MAKYFAQFGNDATGGGGGAVPFSTIFAHRLYDNPDVIPYCGYFVADVLAGFGSFEDLAQANADVVKAMADAWVAAGRSLETFRWAWWPHNWGKANEDEGVYRFFNHPSDFINNGTDDVVSIWSTNSIANYRAFADNFIPYFAAALETYGLPDPVYVDADWEGGGGTVQCHANSHTSYTIYQADPRYTTELIDGRQTLAEFVANYTDINGDPLDPETEMFPGLYVSNLFGAETSNFNSSLSFITADWILHKTLYEPCKIAWPSVKVGDYGLCAGSREHPVYNYRPKESAVDFNSNMRADIGVTVIYGLGGPYDDADAGQATNLGFRQYYEMVERLDIDTGLGADAQITAMAAADAAFQYRGTVLSAPTKQHAVWTSWGEVTYNHPEWLSLASAKWPPGDATVTYDAAYMLAFISDCIASGISYFGLYEPQMSTTHTSTVLDFWADLIDALPVVTERTMGTGMSPPTTPPVHTCTLNIQLRADPGLTTYAVIQGTFEDVPWIWSVTDSVWMTAAEFAGDAEALIGIGAGGGTKTLTEDTHIGGNYFGTISNFYISDQIHLFGNTMTIDYYRQVGGSPDTDIDERIGTQRLYWDDLTCTDFVDQHDYEEHKSTHGVQTGDNSNDGLADCCGNNFTNTDRILSIVRDIRSKINRTPGGK